MTITQNIRWARVKLIDLRRDLKKANRNARAAHDKWVYERKNGSQADRDRAFKRWQAAVKHAHELSQKVNAYSLYVNKGAQSGSLDVAKAIARWEGGRGKDGLFHPYKDPVGVWTIGYGHTAGVNANSHPLSPAEATTLLLHDLNTEYAPAVRAALTKFKWTVNQKMFDAVLSFVYNLGVGMLQPGHDISSALAARSVDGTARAMLLYDKAGNPPRVLDGLRKRREWESQLFKGGSY